MPGGLAYDAVVLAMVAGLRRAHGLDEAAPLVLWGFSGGAQMAQRLALAHPRRVSAVALAAPGRPTALDPGRPWWQGVGGMAELFGAPLDHEGVRRIRFHLAVGAADVEPPAPLPGRPAGDTRVSRLATLATELHDLGAETTHVVVPEVGHERGPLLDAARDFLRDTLRGRTSGPSSLT